MRQADVAEALSGFDAVARIWRRRGVFAIVAGATLLVAIAALVLLPVRYLATASVIIAEQEPGANTSAAWAQKIGDPADMESQLLVIRSPRLLRQIMSTPGVVDAVVSECERGRLLGSTDACQRLKSDTGAFIDHVESRFSVASAGRSRVINISYQSGLAEVSQALANALTQTFLEDQRTEGANSREVASSWLWQELKQLDQQLRESDEKIQKFRRTKGLMRGANAPISSERLTSIGQQLSQAEAARAEAAARLQEIKSEQERGPTDAPSVLQSRTIADLKQQLTSVSAQLASAAGVLGPKHPSILALTREQATIQQRLVDEMQSIAASAQKAFDANDTLVNTLKKRMDTAKAEAGSATLDEASIESMVRDTEIKRQQYAELYKKASELETERRVLRGSTRLVSLAELPSKPFFPKKIPFLAAGMTLAIIFGVGAALLADQLGSRAIKHSAPVAPPEVAPQPAAAVAARDEVAPDVDDAPASVPELPEQAAEPSAPVEPSLTPERRSHFPSVADVSILACLPRLKTLRQMSALGAILQGHQPLAIPQVLRLASEDTEFQHALHDLVRELGLDQPQRPQRIAVTSPDAGDGKTTTVCALAEHLAAAGRRVLLVECELARPAFAQLMALAPTSGWLRALDHGAPVRDAVMRTDHAHLDVLPVGTTTGPVGDILEALTLDALLSGLDGYDAILVDTPLPAQGGDFLTGIDWAIVCVGSDRSSIEPAVKAVSRSRALGAGDVGIVVTMTESERRATSRPEQVSTAAYARAG
ncbi:exopolysaccharide transport family protein [Bradyrhizobium ontarionense]|uniref:Exopolysaccharide transport family protein n=1 Tax=Bradyrhizobium ontarionense TaxID=2898149 RepID=A0ABY3R482_9BRAD|nr:exopolysaccharide transport family protein [Bradyrhizobium sp. A19]UFZ01857.1 exopolysaccharide transport family protein [Bradyrhizobium sp. A19]